MEGEDFMLLSVVNISRIHMELKDIEIKINKNINSAVLSSPSGEKGLKIKDSIIKIPLITDGTFIIIK